MEHSPTYLALEEMIRMNWITDNVSEFNQVLDQYEQDGRITEEEHRSLIELYRAALNTDE